MVGMWLCDSNDGGDDDYGNDSSIQDGCDSDVTVKIILVVTN